MTMTFQMASVSHSPLTFIHLHFCITLANDLIFNNIEKFILRYLKILEKKETYMYLYMSSLYE
jgi:hypothetical protein